MTSGTSVFVDSTTLIYVRDPTEPLKSATAAAWLKALARSDALVLSGQVLNETYAVLVRKPRFATDRATARRFVGGFVRRVTPVGGPALLPSAWRIEDAYGVPFYDALLLAAAQLTRCGFFLSEDLNDGQDYDGVRVINPFRHLPEDVLGRAL